MITDTVVIVCAICSCVMVGMLLACATGYLVYVERERLRQEGLMQRARLRADPGSAAAYGGELGGLLGVVGPLLRDPAVISLLHELLPGVVPAAPPPRSPPGQTLISD